MIRANRKIKFFLLAAMIAVAVAAFLSPALQAAELNLGLEQVEPEIALPTTDIRVVITRIINVALGFLGIMVVLIILYGGFTWMTAGGDVDRVESAKKIITNGIIGLIIIILSFAFSSFILRRLQEAAGLPGPGGGPGGRGGVGGGLPSGAFFVRGITPSGVLQIRNVTVRIVFSQTVDASSLDSNITVARSADGVLVPGRLTSSLNVVEFFPDAPCPDGNGDGVPDAPSCFDADTDYRVSVSTGVRDSRGRNLQCGGLAPSCVGTFRTGNLVDAAPPTVEITAPDDGASVPVDSIVPLQAFGRDDSGISYIEFTVDGSTIDSQVPVGGYADSEWNTGGATIGRHTISARAYDFDTNSALAAPVSVAVRPAHCFNGLLDGDEDGIDCGGSCGACAAGACAENADCASGDCRGGICIETPRIDDVLPGDGRSGTFVTISGAYFGAVPGRVLFRSAGGEVAALAAPCAESWRDTQIVVVVPDGAIDGPIRVEAVSGESDQTNDVRGPVIPDFDVNEVSRPGVCRIVPTSARPDETFTLEGLGFGSAAPGRSVSFGGRTAAITSWSNESIVGTVPRISSGRVPVQVVVDSVVSNPVYFSVLSLAAGTLPQLSSITPASGPKGEYVTLSGDNFGESLGTVIFRNPRAGDEARADVNFPASCSEDFWHNNSVTVKVPRRYNDGVTELAEILHTVRITRADGATSNTVDFTVTSGTPRPGLCRIFPDNGPTGTNVIASGERFGAVAGEVIFSQNVAVTPPAGAWSDGEIRVTVPSSAITGPVRVRVGAQESNPVNFAVQNCNQVACGAGFNCCQSTGVCVREGETCVGGALFGGYAYRISTGPIPTTPRVIEECREGISPSPSPWDARRGGTEVCVNAVVNVRFTTDIDPASLVPGNIIVSRCTGAGADVCAESVPVPGRIDSSIRSFRFTPAAALSTDTTYAVTLTTGIRADGLSGGNMEENAASCGAGNAYCFRFRTRSDAALCAIGSTAIDPPDFVSREMQDLPYNASALSSDDICISLNADSYNWSWSLREEDGRPISGVDPEARVTNADFFGGGIDGLSPDGRVDSQQTVTTLLETVPEPPIYVHATAEGRLGRGRLTIDFTDPEVVETWPICNSACVNAEVAARFNTRMDPAIFSGNVFLRRCVNESCRITDQEVEISPSYDEDARIVSLGHRGLESSRYYRVMIGAAVRSTSGVALTRLNYGDFYSWTFRTRDDGAVCRVSSVEVSPRTAQLNYLGAKQVFRSIPASAPDECSPGGQRLTAIDYSWGWNITDRNVAELLDDGMLNVLPLSGTLGCSDNCLHTGSSAGLPVCGNGIRERGEDCDDGNTSPRDGCSVICLNEGSDSDYGSDCGDSAVDTGEDCDDGNTAFGDGCSAFCLNEGSSAGGSLCGNGDLGDGEDCDDGNTTSGDGCSAECLNEGSITGPIPVCGNGRVEDGEDCDDGNTNSRDGCSSRCLNEGRAPCSGGLRINCCGNNNEDAFEDCDDGNTMSGDGCSSVCLLEGSSFSYGSICGNGADANDLEIGEECEFTSRDALVDPLQVAQAESQGDTQVNAETEGQTGTANLSVQCVCQNDSMCTGGGFPDGLGCGTDRCCAPRPAVEVVSPLDGSADACRNSMITAKFSVLMDGASFNAETVRLDEAAVGGVCPDDSRLIDGIWCEGGTALHLGTRTIVEVMGETAVEKTILQVSSTSTLRALTRYRVRIKGDPNISDNTTEGVKSRTGVGMDGSYTWTFTTGNDICSLDVVSINPSPVTFLTTSDPDGTKQVRAVAYSRRGGNLVEIAGNDDYGWEWSWADSDVLDPDSRIVTRLPGAAPEEQILTARPRNGQITLTATAEIVRDTFFDPTTARRLLGADIIPGRRVSDTALVIVNLCENPWPERIGNFWEPFRDEATNFSFFYCRDRGADGPADDLPGLIARRVPAPPSPNILVEYLFQANPCPPDGVGCRLGDALGMRIVSNGEHLSPRDWYFRQGFRGSPAAKTIDGFAGLEDGRTVYVNAANKVGDPIYTNIYILSYNEGAGDDVVAAREQLLGNWKLATNVGSAKRCVDSDGAPMFVGAGADRTVAVCVSDADCRQLGEPPQDGFCNAQADKLRRDTIRLSDLRSMEIALDVYKNSHKHCSRSTDRICVSDVSCPRGEGCVGDFPRMTAGTFIPSLVSSRWSSWQTLGGELGVTMPTDPLNKYSSCPDGADSETCWNSINQTYVCEEASNVYHYRNRGGTRYELGAELEFGPLPHEVDDPREADAALRVNLWAPLPSLPISPEPVFYELNFNEQCQGVVISANNLCGDGVVGPDEQCEAPSTDIIACVQADRSGFVSLTCGPDCRWISSEGCQTGRCGDGVVQDPESCDDGARNGSYGRCNVSCTGLADRCGDGVRQGPEVCDEGENNGQYNHCAWDCRSNPGTFCGDGIKNGTEACDGERGVSAVEGLAVCVPNAQGFPTARNCQADCSWSACVATGFCGNGIREGREACDDGNAVNTDGCIIILGEGDLSRTCVAARCGDGFTRAGVELCDAGRDNGIPCAPGYGISCNYCTNLCNPATVSGGTCGDGRVSGPEVCDGNLKAGNIPVGENESCHANCLAICPPTYEERGITWKRPPLGDEPAAPPATSIEVSSNEEVTMVIPACKITADAGGRCVGGDNPGAVCAGDEEACDEFGRCVPVDECPGGVCVGGQPITADLQFTEAEPAPIDVVLVTDLSGSMNTRDADCEDPDGDGNAPGADSRIECTRKALKTAIDSLFDSYPRGLMRIGLVEYGAISGESTINTPEICGDDKLCDDPTAHRRALKDVIDSYIGFGSTPTSLGINHARCILNGSQDSHHVAPLPKHCSIGADAGEICDADADCSGGGAGSCVAGCPVPITRESEELRSNIKIILLMSDGEPFPARFNPANETEAVKRSIIFRDEVNNEDVTIPPAYVYSLAFTSSDPLKKNMIDWSSDCRTSGVSEWNSAQCLFETLADHDSDLIHDEFGYSSSADVTPLYSAIIGSIAGIRVTIGSEDDVVATAVFPGGDRPLSIPVSFSCNRARPQEVSARVTYKGRGIMRVSDTRLSACYP